MKAEEKRRQGSKRTPAKIHVTCTHPVLTDEEREKWHEEIRQAMIRFMIADERKKAQLAREKQLAKE